MLYGLPGHPEAEGILGHAGTPHRFLVSKISDIATLPALRHPVMLCQTTLNHTDADALFDALIARFPDAHRGGTICHASFDRQRAVEKLVKNVDALLVIGSEHSSNANRLKEIGIAAGIPAWLVEGPEQFPRLSRDSPASASPPAPALRLNKFNAPFKVLK